MHELPLVSTIAVGLSMAFLCGFIAQKLKLSPLIGYILAGVIVGPHSPGFIADIHIAEQLSEIGIVLLMFGVGLHFSIEDVMEVRQLASLGAFLQLVVVTLAGMALASLWGWGLQTGLVFGLALSVASTVVLLRALEEHHLLQNITGKIAIGWLVVEDVAMILALVLIPTLVMDGIDPEAKATAIAKEIIITLGKVSAFAVIMFVVGRRVLPPFLSAVARAGSRELFTLAVISLAMGVAFGAAMLFGVSLALGAFFAGMMIRESDLNYEVAARVLPFQDAFAVLFFVSVGMLFYPSILIEQPLQVLAVVSIIILFKGTLTYFVVRAFGYTRPVSLLTAAGLAQVGEFSFILIALGTTLGMMPPEVRSLTLGAALISIALNPIVINICKALSRKYMSLPAAPDDALAHLEKEEQAILKNFILLIGKGTVGKYVTDLLDFAAIDLVIVDNNREKVEELRERGYHAIAGNAAERETLIEAQIHKADAVIITIPDQFETRRVVELVQELRPSARILVRSHNDEERQFFELQQVHLAVNPKEEIARRMVERLGSI